VLALASTAFAGLPGHSVPWFSGDLAYHIGVSRTITPAHLAGFGPYAGLPSYYGGTFPLALQVAHAFSLSPEAALTTVSWFEPALWVASAGYLAVALWPAARSAQLTFVVLLIAGAGVGHSSSNVSVNAPTLSAQVFWPLYPRDLTIMLTLLAVGCALRKRWVLAGVLSGLALATEVQIGVLCCLLTGLALVTVHGVRRGGRYGLSSLAVAGLVSTWWWLPRVIWVADYGTALKGDAFGGDVSHSWHTIVQASGLLLPLALLGVVGAYRLRREPTMRFLLAWAAVAGIAVAGSLLVSSELLSFRRTLVLAGVPLAALATTGIQALLATSWGQRQRAWLPVFLCVVALAPSVPTLARTRAADLGQFESQTVAGFSYPESSWTPVWKRLRVGDGQVLSAPQDASVTWFQTGRPVAWAIRPGYLKTWFDVGAATGWAEATREREVTEAFSGRRPVMCALLQRRHIDLALLRSGPNLLGTFDRAGVPMLRGLLVEARGSYSSSGRGAIQTVNGPARLELKPRMTGGLTRLSVWQPGNLARPSFSLTSSGTVLAAMRHAVDGDLTRFDFTVPPGRARTLSLATLSEGTFQVARIVGYQPFSDSRSGPATLVSRARLCR
jgi:hypothetical protein